jgi:hypothetical protein
VTCLSKCVTDSDVFINASLTVLSLVAVVILIGSNNDDPTVMDRDQNEQEQTRHCQWRVYTILHKDATDSEAEHSGALPFVNFKSYFDHSYY